MDGELVKPKSSVEDHKALVEYLDDQCPYYIAMGMTYSDYWDGDPAMCIAYRKAQDIKRRQVNFDAWLQGAYVYDAIADLAPSLRAFSKGRSKPYRKDVIPVLKSEQEEQEERKKKERYEQNLARFKGIVEQINESIKNKEAEADGSRDGRT